MTGPGGPPAPLRRLHVAGVDVTVNAGGAAWLLEVNDRPLHLGDGAVAGGPVAMLAADLLAASPSGGIGIVLAPAFVLRGEPWFVARGPVDCWARVEDAHRGDSRVAGAVADLIAFTGAATRLGGTVTVVDHRAAVEDVLAAGTPLWSRSAAPVSAATATVNHPDAARWCVDKQAAATACADVPGLLPVWPAAEAARHVEAAGVYAMKPRTGSGSRDIARLTAAQVRECCTQPEAADSVIQPWRDSATLHDRGHAYHFDLRVFVIGGRCGGVLARRAAAPDTAAFADSPLCWLTTTGPTLAVAAADAIGARVVDGVALLPAAWLTAAIEVAENAVAAIEAAAPTPSPPAPSFARLHAITGPVRPVQLVVAPA